MMKIRLLLILTLLMAWPVALSAQDTPISYGEVIRDDITHENFERVYTFAGEAGDIVVADARRIGLSGLFNQPDVFLLAEDGSTVATSGPLYSIYAPGALLVAELPADGDYQLLVTRRDGRGGTDTGAFSLKLVNAPLLDDDEIAGTVSRAAQDSYYAVKGEDTFHAGYTRSAGRYSGALTVYTLAEQFGRQQYTPVASLIGAGYAGGSLLINGSADQLYIVAVSARANDYDDDRAVIDLEYEIRLLDVE